ncbi:MAG: hypothetical protein CMK00_02880 [Planctomycetes bacterium]|jgi:glycosyltransferase involved in cell wall biosynthesis|nr:hypothetical protein [Planctomycetota bacterium]HJO26059.1 DUF3524 domain-containing protein [Planctomycetota bacterium]
MDPVTGAERLTVLALEPWFGGSHRQFLEQFAARSRHAVRILGLAPRHYKWRMKAGAWELGMRLEREQVKRPDVLLLSDFVDVPALFGCLPPDWADVPALLYFHENQLTYPVRRRANGGPPGGDAAEHLSPQADHHYGLTNILSCLRARGLVFNSRFHLDDFAGAARELLGILPRPRPLLELQAALAEARVVSPGIDLEELDLGPGPGADAPLRVLFPHRAEHDKRPEDFVAAALAALARLKEAAQLEFVCLGEGDSALFDALPAERLVQRGRLESRADYARMLGSCDLVLSTAGHEFFGMAVAEALAAGCTPLLPRRLNYPDLIGPETGNRFAGAGLYDTPEELVARLVAAAREPAPFRLREQRARMRALVHEFDAPAVAAELDTLLGACWNSAPT